jgi:hypothetical protein
MGNNGLFAVIAPMWIAICENKKIVYNYGFEENENFEKVEFRSYFF